MKTRKACFLMTLGVSALLGPLAPAEAGSTRIHLHHSDFYARAPESFDADRHPGGEGVTPASACYVSLSATEATRGIRHWTGKC